MTLHNLEFVIIYHFEYLRNFIYFIFLFKQKKFRIYIYLGFSIF